MSALEPNPVPIPDDLDESGIGWYAVFSEREPLAVRYADKVLNLPVEDFALGITRYGPFKSFARAKKFLVALAKHRLLRSKLQLRDAKAIRKPKENP